MAKSLRSHSFDRLYKQCEGKVQEWDIKVEEQRDGTAIIFTIYGYENGKKQTKRDVVRDGKKKGTRAETDPFQQAVLDAEGKWKKQIKRKCYGLTAEESSEKRDIAPMLAYPLAKCRAVDWGNAFGQYKYDGHRCLIHCEVDGSLRLVSREFGAITTMEHVADAYRGLLKPGQVLDGELYRHGMTLNEIGSIIKNKSEDKGRERLKFYVFDQIMDAPFEERFDLLRRLVPRKHDATRLAPTIRVNNQQDMAVVERDALENQFEGAILRHGRRGYQTGKRVTDVLKIKQFVDGEFKVIDAKTGRTDYADCAIFICETDKGHEFDVLAPGSMDEKRQYWKNYRDYIGRMLTVKFQKFTATEEPVPFQPVAKGFVKD